MLRRNLFLCNQLNLAMAGGTPDLCLGLWGMKLGLGDLLKKEKGERTQTKWTMQCNSSISPRIAVLNMASHWKQLVLSEFWFSVSLFSLKLSPMLGQIYSCAGVWGACRLFFFLPWRIFQGLQPLWKTRGTRQSTLKWLVLLHIDLLPSRGCQGASLKQKRRSGTERNNKGK